MYLEFNKGMSNPILIESGMAYQVAGSGKVHKNAINLQSFTLKPHGGRGKSSCEKSIALAQSIQITNNNIVSQINGLDDVKAIYTGGADFGTCQINALILTGGSKGDGSQPKKLLEVFSKKSLAKSTKPLNAKWGNYSFKLYLTNIQTGIQDTATGSITVTLSGTIAPVKNKG